MTKKLSPNDRKSSESFEWFQSLLLAIEEQDLENVSFVLYTSELKSINHIRQFIEIQ